MNYIATITLPQELAQQWETVPKGERSKLIQGLLREHFKKTRLSK